MAAGDFNGDNISDLAIGVPNENIYIGPSSTECTSCYLLYGHDYPPWDISNAGAVNIIYGSGTGLRAKDNQFWDEIGITKTESLPWGNESLGSSLATGDFNGDSVSDLAIGAPGYRNKVGRVNILYGRKGTISYYGNRGGLTEEGSQSWYPEDLLEIDEYGNDSFGFSLTAGYFDGDIDDNRCAECA